ncbi:hypothetical protein ACJJI5_21600 [Microbulbifer sp. EKSA008]
MFTALLRLGRTQITTVATPSMARFSVVMFAAILANFAPAGERLKT